jgi:predicted Zn finger-like uncharacterized protein
MKFLCDNCKAKYQIGDDRIAGKAVRMKCRRCGHDIHLSSIPQDVDPRPLEASISNNSVLMEAPSPIATPLPISSPFGSRPDVPRAGSIHDDEDDDSTAIMSSPLQIGRRAGHAAPPSPALTRGAPAPGTPSPLGHAPPAPPAARRPLAAAPLGSRTAVHAPVPGASPGTPHAPPRPGLAARPNATPAPPPAKAIEAPSELVVAPVASAVAEEWYVGINGVPLGPVSISVIRDRAIEGAITAESLVWREGFGAWKPLREVSELINVVRGAQDARSSLLVAVALPPTLPPAARPGADVAAPAVSPAASLPGGPRFPSSPGRVTSSMAAAPTASPAVGRVTGTMAAAASSASLSTDPWTDAASDAPRKGTPLDSPHEPVTSEALLAASSPFGPSAKPPLPIAAPGTPLGPCASAAPVPVPSAPLDEAPRVLGVLSDPFAQPPPPAPLGATSAPTGRANNLAPPAPLEIELDAPIRIKRSHGPPVMAYAFVAMAAVFGGVAAYVLFLKQPQVIVVQQQVPPPPSAAAAPEKRAPTAQVDEPTTEHSAAPTSPKAPSSAVAGGPRPKGSTTGAPAPFDTSGFVSTIPGPTSTPPPSQGSGQLSAGEIQGVVIQNQPLVRRKCWQPALDAKSPSAPSNARVMGTIVIGASGNVESSAASGGERDFPGLSSCIAARMKTWKFPPSGSASPPVQVPFVFAGQ